MLNSIVDLMHSLEKLNSDVYGVHVSSGPATLGRCKAEVLLRAGSFIDTLQKLGFSRETIRWNLCYEFWDNQELEPVYVYLNTQKDNRAIKLGTVLYRDMLMRLLEDKLSIVHLSNHWHCLVDAWVLSTFDEITVDTCSIYNLTNEQLYLACRYFDVWNLNEDQREVND